MEGAVRGGGVHLKKKISTFDKIHEILNKIKIFKESQNFQNKIEIFVDFINVQ